MEFNPQNKNKNTSKMHRKVIYISKNENLACHMKHEEKSL